MIVETVIFKIMNTVMIVDLCRYEKQRNMNSSSVVSGHDSKITISVKMTIKYPVKITIQIVR